MTSSNYSPKVCHQNDVTNFSSPPPLLAKSWLRPWSLAMCARIDRHGLGRFWRQSAGCKIITTNGLYYN